MLMMLIRILGGGVHTVKEGTDASVVANKGTRLEENADKTKYIVMSRDKNEGRSYNIKIYNSSFERVE